MLIDVVRSIINLCEMYHILLRGRRQCVPVWVPILLYLADVCKRPPRSPRDSGFLFHWVLCCSLLQPLLRRCCTGAAPAGHAIVTAQGKLTAPFSDCSCASAFAQRVLWSTGPLNAVGRQCAECCGTLPHLPCPTHPQPSEHGFLHRDGAARQSFDQASTIVRSWRCVQHPTADLHGFQHALMSNKLSCASTPLSTCTVFHPNCALDGTRRRDGCSLIDCTAPAVPLSDVQGGLNVLLGDARLSCGFSCCSVSLLLCTSLLKYLWRQKSPRRVVVRSNAGAGFMYPLFLGSFA